MEPVGKLNAHFPTVTEHINKRNKKVSKPTSNSYIPPIIPEKSFSSLFLC